LIVDESIRADYLDINGHNMGITPYLFSRKDRLINFGYASSGANCSAESNQILRFGPNPNDFEKTFKTNPSIWQYAKKAGYKTIMIEGQATEGTLNNRMTKNEVSNIDEFIYVPGNGSLEKDIYIAKIIKEKTSENYDKPIFIIAVKSGLHFPYNEKVPDVKNKSMSNSNGLNFGTKNELINSYKRGISYLVDDFFYSLIENVDYEDTVLIYTSDHGQNLLDNGKKLTHCSSSNTSPYEGLVPLIVYTGNKSYINKFEIASNKNKDKASHFNIFPTVLSIFGYKNSDVENLHGITLFGDIWEPRKFISGLLSGSKIGIGTRNSIDWHYLPEKFVSNSPDTEIVRYRQ